MKERKLPEVKEELAQVKHDLDESREELVEKKRELEGVVVEGIKKDGII